MTTVLIISILAIATLLLTFLVLKTLTPLAKKKNISVFLAFRDFVFRVDM